MPRTKTKNKKKQHTWRITTTRKVIEGRELYTPVKCVKCGITGRRYFPSTLITIDNAHLIKTKYFKCNGKNKKK